jgi:hypothetical protein
VQPRTFRNSAQHKNRIRPGGRDLPTMPIRVLLWPSISDTQSRRPLGFSAFWERLCARRRKYKGPQPTMTVNRGPNHWSGREDSNLRPLGPEPTPFHANHDRKHSIRGSHKSSIRQQWPTMTGLTVTTGIGRGLRPPHRRQARRETRKPGGSVSGHCRAPESCSRRTCSRTPLSSAPVSIAKPDT